MISARLALRADSRITPFAAPLTHIDDEYAQAGIEDPRVLITTSRDPSSKLQQFAKVRWEIDTVKARTADARLACPCFFLSPLDRSSAFASLTRHASTAETTSCRNFQTPAARTR